MAEEEKSYSELMKEYEEALLNGTPQQQASILDRAAKVAKSDLEMFDLSTKIQGFKQRYGG